MTGCKRRGLEVESLPEPRSSSPPPAATVVSGLLLPIGVLVLLSFGAQIVFGPFVLAIEWILARVSAQPIRIAWCLLAGALAGEITYLLLDLQVSQIDGVLAVVAGVLTAVLVTPLFISTTRPAI